MCNYSYPTYIIKQLIPGGKNNGKNAKNIAN